MKALAETIRLMPQTMQGIAREAAATALRQDRAEHRQGLSVRSQLVAAVLACVVTVCTLTTTIVTVVYASGGLR